MTSIDIYSSVIPVTQSKTCTICNINKLLILFSKRKKSKDGHKASCKECNNKYHQINKERDNARSKKNHKINKEHDNNRAKEYYKKWYEDNKEHNKERCKIYKKDNKGIVNSHKAKRRASKLNATPFWSEIILIKQMYIDCRALSESTGIMHHVDHIVPLQSDFVCGLHCIANLRIITAIENFSKSNRHWENM